MRVAVGTQPRSSAASLAQQALACTFFAALIAVFARISIYVPFTPVPFSLQPLAIMLTGLFLGSSMGAIALLEYLAAGAVGAPVFAGGNGGFAYLATTSTLGYLLAYPVAVFAIGRIAEAGRFSFWRRLAACLTGLAVIYLGGNGYLSFWLHKGALQTLLLGAAPFVAFDVVKAGIAAGVANKGSASWFSWRGR